MRNHALITLLVVANLALLIIAAAPKQQPKVLTVSEIDVVDAKGVIRARLGGDLPDAVVNGKRLPRGGKAAGLMLYDDTGQERGGYVTFTPGGNIALTMDFQSPPQQAVTLVTGPHGGAALMLRQGQNHAEMRVDDELGPSLHIKEGQHVAFHVPPAASIEKTELCRDLRAALKKAPREQIVDFCRSRTSEEACQACLGQ